MSKNISQNQAMRFGLINDRKKRVKEIIYRLKQLFPKASIALDYGNNWELLIAVMLSAQCTDRKVNEVTRRLFKKYRHIDNYASASRRELERDIYSTGFYRNKAKNIIAAAQLIQKKFHGRIPKTMPEMLSIPGVARKTANVVLGNAYGLVEGIAVDTHVIRLARRWGLSSHTDPIKIERDLMALVPRKDWFHLTYLFIEYGRKYCSAKPHKHDKCPLRNFDFKT